MRSESAPSGDRPSTAWPGAKRQAGFDLPFAERRPGKLLLLGLLAPYLFLALRRVYPGPWWATLVRTALLAVAQGFIYLAAMLGLLLLTVVWA